MEDVKKKLDYENLQNTYVARNNIGTTNKHLFPRRLVVLSSLRAEQLALKRCTENINIHF